MGGTVRSDEGAVVLMRQHAALQNHKRQQPFTRNAGALTWGKVVARHPEDNSVDLAMQNGSTYQHVQVNSPFLGSQLGQVYLPKHDLANPVPSAGGTHDVPGASGKGDLYALVGFPQDSRQPVVLGFFTPAQNEMTFQTLGIKVDRHESGVYHVTLPTGHDERHFPDGSYFVVGDTQSYDMTAENQNWNPPTQSSPAPVVFHHASGTTITIQPSGAVQINSVAGISLSTTSVGQGTHPVAFADVLQSWLNGHTHTSANAGSPTSPPISPVSGISAASLTAS